MTEPCREPLPAGEKTDSSPNLTYRIESEPSVPTSLELAPPALAPRSEALTSGGQSTTTGRFQLFPHLTPDEYAALRADIEARGILIPVEVDQHGEVLDGFHRLEIAHELGIEAPTVQRTFASEEGRLAHVIALNLKRRHLDPVSWGEFFMRYCEAQGARLGSGKGDPTGKADKVAALALELGVPERTARRRLEAAPRHAALGERAGRQWAPCTRCIGGQVIEQWAEAVCLQCGYRPASLNALPYTRAKWQ